MKPKTLTIGQVSKFTRLPPKTIRYYEEIGLIKKANRSDNGYRQYSQESLKHLTHIKIARDLGLPIKQIKKLITGCSNNCEHDKQTIQTDLEQFINSITQQITQLSKLKQKLTHLKQNIDHDQCNTKNTKYCCNYLKQLTQIQ